MTQYRKKPVIVEAFKWREESPPAWLMADKNILRVDSQTHECYISTLEGVMIAKPGDFIIKGIKGEIYPCKADIFELTYEPAEEKK